MPPLLLGLEERLSNPITAEQAWALKEAIDRLQLIAVARNEYIEPEVFMLQPYLETVLQWLDYATIVLRWPANASDGWGLFEIAHQDKRLQECLTLIAAGEYPGIPEYCALQGKWRNEARMAFIKRGYFPWAQVYFCRILKKWPRQLPSDGVREEALPCPRCNGSVDKLKWVYYYESYLFQLLRGWLTICDSCHLQVDYFDESGK